MTNPNDFQPYLQDPSAWPRQFFTEEPSSCPPSIQKVPTGFAPMSRIELEGRAYRGLASGSQPWWVMITGWVMVGLPCAMVVTMMMTLGGYVEFAAAIALCALLLWIMYRGTCAKLAQQRAEKQRRAKYRSEMNS